MRFIVYGAGAVGGVVGGRLFEHGHDVLLITRGAHHDAIRDKGLTLESPDAASTLPIPVVPDPGKISFGSDDVVLLAVKSQDTGAAVRALAERAPTATPIACFQNGVENERVVLRSFPRVYGVCVMCPTTHLSPGVVQAHSTPTTGLLDLGRYPSGVDDTAEALATALQASTFSSRPTPDISRWKYAKLLSNLGNAIQVVCRPGAEELRRLVREEGVACLRAAGIAVATETEEAERRGDLLQLRPIAGQRRGGGSSWQSLARGVGSVESDYLNGEIVLLGRLYGVPTPVNAALQRLANQMAHDRVPPGTVPEADVLAAAREGPG